MSGACPSFHLRGRDLSIIVNENLSVASLSVEPGLWWVQFGPKTYIKGGTAKVLLFRKHDTEMSNLQTSLPFQHDASLNMRTMTICQDNKPLLHLDFASCIMSKTVYTSSNVVACALITKDNATTVVGIERKGGKVIQDCEVYIGRACNYAGWNLKKSKWANPFKVGKDGDIHEVLQKYEAHVRANKELMSSLEELRGKVLGCFCKQEKKCKKGQNLSSIRCHGDILLKLLAEK